MKTSIILTLFSLLAGVASAQKLPQKQTTSVWVPQNLKIDGLPNEWSGFQAYNKTTNIFYTLSNDDKNLYLAVEAADPVIIDKITASGITFTVEKKNENQSVTFPAYDKENQAIIDIMMNAPRVGSNKQASLHIDTFIKSHNALRDKRQKIIHLAHNDKESDISVFNDEGIKVSGRIDNRLIYTQELAVPLKYLGINAGESFDYIVQLNGQIPKGAKMVDVGRPDRILYIGTDGQNYTMGGATPENLTLAYPTNFKSKYTMATK